MLQFVTTLRMVLYYTVYINTPFWFFQTYTCARDQLSSPQMTPPFLSHMTSIRCQLLREVCLPTWLHRCTCSVPAVGLLYMAGIIPTSCVPLLLEPFMWLQEERFCGLSCHAVRLNLPMNELAHTQSGNCCDMGGRFWCKGITLSSWDSALWSL